MVYTISIGSNECRECNMALARKRLSELFPGICFSPEEETAPLFFHRQAPFSNQVARFVSSLQADEVIACLKTIEREAGRMPGDKSREIVRLDIDLLQYGTVVHKPEDLKRNYIRKGLEQLNGADIRTAGK